MVFMQNDQFLTLGQRVDFSHPDLGTAFPVYPSWPLLTSYPPQNIISVQSFVVRLLVSVEASVYYCAMLAKCAFILSLILLIPGCHLLESLGNSLHIRSTLKKYVDRTHEAPIHLTTLEPHPSRTGNRMTNDSGSIREGGEL